MPLRRTYILDQFGAITNPSSYGAQTDGIQKTQIVGNGGLVQGMVPTESGNASPIYQTDRPDSGLTVLHRENLSSGVYPIVIIDISDNIKYNHTATNYAHLHFREFDILCDVNGAWALSFGFLKNVTAAGSDLHVYRHWKGAKDVGNSLRDQFDMFPVGAALRAESLTTSQISSNSYFKSDVALPSSVSATTPDVFPNDGDVVVLLEVTGGNVLEFSAITSYHSH